MLEIYVMSWLVYLVIIMFFADADDITDIKNCGARGNLFALALMPAILILGIILGIYGSISKLIKKLIG